MKIFILIISLLTISIVLYYPIVKENRLNDLTEERYIERLEYYYKFKTKQLRIYMPLAIENNANK